MYKYIKIIKNCLIWGGLVSRLGTSLSPWNNHIRKCGIGAMQQNFVAILPYIRKIEKTPK